MPAQVPIAKFTWQTIVMHLPARSPYFAHDECGGQCMRANGSQLKASTIKHVGHVIVDRVDRKDHKSHAYVSVNRLASDSSRDRHTVIMAIGHLCRVGLLERVWRGGGMGVARKVSSVYCLTVPDAGLLALADAPGDAIEQVRQLLAAEAARQAAGERPYQWWERSG